MRRWALHGLFFLSGASALTYELVWQRMLFLVYGVSMLSVSAVLAAFMAGLALGGPLFGRWADRTPRPLHWYALLEIGIGILGLLVVPAFTVLTSAYTWLYAVCEPDPWAGTCLRFVLGFSLLVVPATLMGGTVPIMGRLALRRSNGLPGTFGLLYGANTLGGVAGAALTGFVLLPYAGMRLALAGAACLNFIVAIIAWLAARQSQVAGWVECSEATQQQTDSDKSRWALYSLDPHYDSGSTWALVCAGVTGAVCMGLEVAWTRILGILTSNSAYGFALVLTVLLSGLGVGSLIQSVWTRYQGNAWRRLAFCQWLLAAVTLATLPYFHAAPAWLESWSDGTSAGALFLGELALTATALFGPAVLMGMSLPLLVGAVTDDRSKFGTSLGRLYAVNTLGCLGGAVLSGVVLIPWLGIQATFGVLVAGTVLVGLTAWSLAEHRVKFSRGLVTALVFGFAGAGWFLLPPGVFQKTRLAEPRHLLYYREGNNATVSVVQEPNGTRSILVDGQPVAGTAASSVIDQKMLAHLPLLLHSNPHRALTVGFGSGGTSYSMSLHDIAVDCVEIEAAVPAAAGLFRSENHGVESFAGYRIIIDDARSWLRVAPVRYDVIATDCTNIQYRSNGDLYTVDYFRLMRDRLAPNGLAAAWVPANGIDPADLKTLLRSFRAVFEHTSIWYINTLPTDFLIVVGTPRELDIDIDLLEQRMQRPEVARDLAAVGIGDPCRLVCTLLAAEEQLATYLGEGALNTDDRPVLSYSTYGAAFRSTIAGNLLRLLAHRPDPSRFIRHSRAPQTMLRNYAASNELLLGHIAHLSGAASAGQHYQNAATLLPNDLSLQRLLQTLERHSVQPSASLSE